MNFLTKTEDIGDPQSTGNSEACPCAGLRGLETLSADTAPGHAALPELGPEPQSWPLPRAA